MAVDAAEVDRPAGSAARAEHAQPGRSGDEAWLGGSRPVQMPMTRRIAGTGSPIPNVIFLGTFSGST
jgi:hypothetical protein